MQIPRKTPLTSGDWMTFFPLTEPKATDNLEQVNVSQHVDAEKCD